MIRLVRLYEIDDVWPHLLEGFAEACRRCGDDVSTWHLQMWLRRSDALLFVTDGIKAGLIVRPEQWGEERVARVLSCTGRDMQEWLTDAIGSDVWRAHLGDLPIIFEGREGWKRAIPNARVLRVVYRIN